MNRIELDQPTAAMASRICLHYGQKPQVQKLEEEALELALACRRYLDGRGSQQELICELSDVCLVGWQVVKLSGFGSQELMATVIREKAQRQIKRIGGEYEQAEQ